MQNTTSENQQSIGALFPGQGSQSIGMAQELFDNFKLVQNLFEEASDTLRINLKKLCFEGPAESLNLTEHTQPCLLVSSLAAYRVFKNESDFKPAWVAGHSLGEYTALVANEAIPFSTAVSWVHERGKAMQTAVPVGLGSMAAILLPSSFAKSNDLSPETFCQSLCEAVIQSVIESGKNASLSQRPVLEVANYNSPTQVVLSGHAICIEELTGLVKSNATYSGVKVIPLSVSAPFHSSLMKPARLAMQKLFSDSQFTPTSLSCPYIPNRTAKLCSEPSLILPLLIEQMDQSVQWTQSMEPLIATPVIEFGPGKVLQGLCKRISPEFKAWGVQDLATLKSTLESLGKTK